MITDYKSFIVGVLTGIKLGRIPEDRPTPSDLYILTEEYDIMLAEDGTELITE